LETSVVGTGAVVCNVTVLCMVVNRYGRESLQVLIGFRQVILTPCLVRWIAKCKSLTQSCDVLMVRVVMFIQSPGSQHYEWQGTRYPLTPLRRGGQKWDQARSALRPREQRMELYVELTGPLCTLDKALCRAMYWAVQLGTQKPNYIVQRIGRGSSYFHARRLFSVEEVRHRLLDKYLLPERQWVARERWKCVRIERVVAGTAFRHPGRNGLHVYIYIYMYIKSHTSFHNIQCTTKASSCQPVCFTSHAQVSIYSGASTKGSFSAYSSI